MFELLSPAKTGVRFSNNLSESDSLNILNYVYYYNGGGVGIADFNNDGLEDIFFTGNETSCRLYLNKGKLTFEDVTQTSGVQTTQWCTGVSIADVNNDGWMDIYVCCAGYAQPKRRKNLLFINQGANANDARQIKFIESASAYGLADTAYSTQSAFFDYDRDGDLDLYVMNHANERESVNTPLPKKTHGEGASNDHLYRNNGNQTFTDITQTAGILTEGYGLGIAITDVNHDGWPDIYISNDFIYNDLLYINLEGKSFENRISEYIGHQSYNGMGCDFADYNNDARPDLIVVDMLPESDSGQKRMAGAMTWDKSQLIAQAGYEPQYVRNTLQTADDGRRTADGMQHPAGGYEVATHNEPSAVGRRPSAVYAECAQMAGVAATDWSWAPLFADFDNDGWKDLFISNGYLRDITDKDFISYSKNLSMFKSVADADRDMLPEIRKLKGRKLPNRVFQNNRDLTFSPRFTEWGINDASFSNGAAYADLDNDGDLDLVVNNLNEAAFIYENRSDKILKNYYLNIELEGVSSNAAGVGASVLIKSGGQKQYLEQYLSRGFMSSVTDVLHFGLGKTAIIDTLQVHWSDGREQMLFGVSANQTLKLRQSDAGIIQAAAQTVSAPIIMEVSGLYGIDFTHQSPIFNDFKTQPLLLHSLLEYGPALAAGDLNGDGLDDFFVGGGQDQSGWICFQKRDGTFSQKPFFEPGKAAVAAALIFDADGDGKQDLYLVSGSAAATPGSQFYQDRLYMNDGKGNLSLAVNALPEMYSPGSCIAAEDFDRDGDLDLFVGGSAEPGRYPLPARSYLLQNDHGRFSDVTEARAPDLKNPGIITAAQWTDINRDGLPDLILTGEWMPVSVFLNGAKGFTNATEQMGLKESSGWWSALAIADLDKDGDMDLIAGNFGLNSRFKASEQNPLTIYASDFDRNGSLDAVTCRRENGKEKPVHQRDELLAQINGLSKKYPRYSQYANASIQDIFGENILLDAYFRRCNQLKSTCFFQENGRFISRPLPLTVQATPINAILCDDFNGDQYVDILMAGNSNAPNISTGRLDAGKGFLMLGDGKGNFETMEAAQSGFWLEGVAKSLATLTLISGAKDILAGINNGPLRIFELNGSLLTSRILSQKPAHSQSTN